MGQWQRIALAQTLYADAQVLVLDEPTSWMDAEAEEKFYRHLEQVKKGKIVLLVQHNTHNTTMDDFSLPETHFVDIDGRAGKCS